LHGETLLSRLLSFRTTGQYRRDFGKKRVQL